MVWLPTFLIEQRGTGTGAAAAMTALVVAVNVAGNVGAGWMLRHNAPRWLLLAVAGATMGLASLGIFSSEVPDGTRYLLCLVFSSVGGMLPTSLLSGVPVFAPSPRQYATGNGFLTQGANVGQVIGPPAVATLVAATGVWESASWLMAGTAGAIVVFALAIGAVERRLPTAEPAAPPR
jgi:cyanate permease